MSAPRHLALFLSAPSGGGAQRRMRILGGAFAARGHRVDLVVASPRGPAAPPLPPELRLVVLDPPLARLPAVSRRRSFFVPLAAPALARYLGRERPDALLSTSNPANATARLARRLSGTDLPLVLCANVHLSAGIAARPRLARPLLRALARRCYAGSEAVVAISQGVADDLVDLGIPRERIFVIPIPVPVAEIRARSRAPLAHPWLSPGEAPLLLAVGKLEPQKDFPTLLRAFARVRACRPARLVILGEGEQRGRLEALARELEIAADVELPGFDPNPPAWMARASVFVLSSAWEGSSNALAEALACGCPVVSTDCPSGPAELLDRGAFGRLVPVGDDRELARAVLETLEARKDPERLRRRAESFSVDAAADRHLEVVSSACAAARGELRRPGGAGPAPQETRGRAGEAASP